jgi:hypothetical protein
MSQQKKASIAVSKSASNHSFFGILVVISSYLFLGWYLVWIFLDLLPEGLAWYFPSKMYRVVLPAIIIGSFILYMLFNYVSWKI